MRKRFFILLALILLVPIATLAVLVYTPLGVSLVAGQLHRLHNAGIYIGKPFTDYTFDDYLAITAVKLTGFFHITQRTILQMINSGGGLA